MYLVTSLYLVTALLQHARFPCATDDSNNFALLLKHGFYKAYIYILVSCNSKLSSSNDRSCQLPARSRLPLVEMLLPDRKSDNRHSAGPFRTTGTGPSSHDSTTGSNPQDPEPRTQEQRQRYL